MARRTLPLDLGGAETPHFEGFGADAYRFFEELAARQDRDWFQANKARYDTQVRLPFEALVVDVSNALRERDIPLRGTPKSLFRIHRDVRFSKDKRPYKTHAGAVLTRGGAKGEPGILYIHLAPEGCFTAAGYYHPEPETLAAIRKIIAGRPQTWREIVAALDGAGLPLGEEDKLTRLPRGFEATLPPDLIEALKLKSFVVRRPLSREVMAGPKAIDAIAGFAEDARPLFRLA